MQPSPAASSSHRTAPRPPTGTTHPLTALAGDFSAATGTTPLRWLPAQRIRHAQELLERTADRETTHMRARALRGRVLLTFE